MNANGIIDVQLCRYQRSEIPTIQMYRFWRRALNNHHVSAPSSLIAFKHPWLLHKMCCASSRCKVLEMNLALLNFDHKTAEIAKRRGTWFEIWAAVLSNDKWSCPSRSSCGRLLGIRMMCMHLEISMGGYHTNSPVKLPRKQAALTKSSEEDMKAACFPSCPLVTTVKLMRPMDITESKFWCKGCSLRDIESDQ